MLPAYLAFFVPGLHVLIDVRILRLLRVFRILKLTAHPGVPDPRQALRARGRKIFIFISTVVMVVILLGTVMYVVEGPENGFTSIPVSIYWAITTITTVGFGDITPQTDLGRLVSSFVMLLGWGILAVPTGIVTAEMTAGGCPHSGAAHGSARLRKARGTAPTRGSAIVSGTGITSCLTADRWLGPERSRGGERSLPVGWRAGYLIPADIGRENRAHVDTTRVHGGRMGAVGVAGGASRDELTAGQVVDCIKARVGMPWMAETVDRIVAGRPEAPGARHCHHDGDARGAAARGPRRAQPRGHARAHLQLASGQSPTPSRPIRPTWPSSGFIATWTWCVRLPRPSRPHAAVRHRDRAGARVALGVVRRQPRAAAVHAAADDAAAAGRGHEGEAARAYRMRVVGEPAMPVRRVAASWATRSPCRASSRSRHAPTW